MTMAQFKTKARAVELLGKGQIADLPTAISELWKNGYDAYARNLGCNLYMPGYMDIKEPLFTLYDDGFGMTEEDLLEKWIVLGTDSKARGMKLYTDEERFGIPQRVPMGEKGIGRLSVSYLGSPMLMLTRKIGKPVELLYFDWNVLENYNLFIDDIDVPIHSAEDIDDLPNIFISMVDQFLQKLNQTLIKGQWIEQKKILKNIIDENSNIALTNALLESEQIKNIFSNNGHGTIFVIFKPDEQLLNLGGRSFEKESENEEYWEIKRSLCGIYNLFKEEPDFNTQFDIYNESGYYNIIDDFYSRKDLNNSDWHIDGAFDKNGLFVGTVRVFNETFQYSYRPNRIPGNTPYGAFELNLAGMELNASSSMLPPEVYEQVTNKTQHFGGLYIYRDNFRVLPYGRLDYDFLNFEKRRSMKAGKYYFSHRKMFGYISITRQENPKLIDKAGREGFIENKAYREFKRDLIDFFNNVADKFFRSVEEGESNARSEQIDKIREKNKKLLEAEKKKSAITRKQFSADIKDFTPRLIELKKEISNLSLELKKKGDGLFVDFTEYNKLAESLEDKKNEFQKLKLEKPTRAKISSVQEQRFANYVKDYKETENIIKQCDVHISNVRKLFDIEDLKRDYENQSRRATFDISSLINSYKKRFASAANKINSQFDEQKSFYLGKLSSNISEYNGEPKTRKDYKKVIDSLVRFIYQLKEEINDKMEPFLKHIEGLNFDVDEEFLVSWYKEQEEKLSDQLEKTDSLAQLGISAEIIDHELTRLYNQMRKSMDVLGGYIKEHPELQSLYSQLDHAFLQIESNYRMLQPLYHTRRRLSVKFSGEQLVKDMRTFFDSKLSSGDVEFEGTISFNAFVFDAPEAVIYSTFINVIDNALYWLISVNDRKITIDYKDNKIFIMNNGPKIDDSELENIFTLFYTRKVNGRGIGLYLARRSLRAIGLDIYASNDKKDNKLNGACFIIKKYEK